MRDGASVQPARLVRGLRRVVLERGVQIHEGTAVTRLDGTTAVTEHGSVKASHAVLAVNAWGIGWPQLNRRVVAWSSYIVLSDPPGRAMSITRWGTRATGWRRHTWRARSSPTSSPRPTRTT